MAMLHAPTTRASARSAAGTQPPVCRAGGGRGHSAATRPLPSQPAEHRRLQRFLHWVILAATAGSLLVLALGLAFHSRGLVVLGVLLGAGVGAFVWAWQQVEQHRVQRAAVAVCLVVWGIAIFLALFVRVPVLNFSVLLVLSVMVALPYVATGALLRLMRGATVLAVVLTLAAMLVDETDLMPFSLRGQVIPQWMFTLIIVVAVPSITGLILLLLWQYADHLDETLVRTREMNRALKQSENQLELRVRELQESRARIVNVQENVRREIAGYLHGRVQGRLLVLRSHLQELLRNPESLPDQATQVISDVVDHIDQISQQELSGLSRRLYPSILRHGLASGLLSLADQFEAIIEVDTQIDAGLERLERHDRDAIPEPVRLAAYRIAEEAMANVIKHARASILLVRLDLPGEREVRLTVQDHGRGFQVGEGEAGLGLASMQDYAGAVGGICRVRSAPGRGTEIVAVLPLPEPATVPSAREQPGAPPVTAAPIAGA